MKILALDSSGLVASVAVTEDDNLLGEYTINYKKTHSQTLLPMLDEVAKMIELDLKTVDAIAVSAGPGSFTGLRIGSATAKGLALALDKKIVSVPTVDALAYNIWNCTDVICPLMDARRQQTYTGLYTFEDGRMQTLLPQCVVQIEEIINKVNDMGKPVVFWAMAFLYLQILSRSTARCRTSMPRHIVISSGLLRLPLWARFFTGRAKQNRLRSISRIICVSPRRRENVRRKKGIFVYENPFDDSRRCSGSCCD